MVGALRFALSPYAVCSDNGSVKLAAGHCDVLLLRRCCKVAAAIAIVGPIPEISDTTRELLQRLQTAAAASCGGRKRLGKQRPVAMSGMCKSV